MNRRQRQARLAIDALAAGRAISATRRTVNHQGQIVSLTTTIQKIGNLYYVKIEEYYPVGYLGEDIRSMDRNFSNMDEAVDYATRESQIDIFNFRP